MTRAGHVLVAILAAAALGGCAGEDGAGRQAVSGAEVFAEAGCGGCHALAGAGSTGSAGPSLDVVRPDADHVARQVRSGGGGMPAFAGRLSDTEIDAVAAYVADTAAQSPVSAAAAFRPDGRELGDCAAGDSACFEQAFGNLAYEAGPKRALEDLAERMETDPTVRVCHRIAHAVGAGGLAHWAGDVGRAFADGDATCWSGYYHGVLERAYAGVAEDELPAVSRQLCESEAVRSSDFVAYQCVHGLGHGLMIVTGYDLPLSLVTCDALRTGWDRTSCTGGVFMENLQASYGTRSRWLRDDDPLYPCPTVAERHKLYCYLMVTSRILDVVGGDWRETVGWCRRAEQDWVATCFQSLGRDASGRSLQEPAEILRVCGLADDMAGQCVYGAARDVTSMDAGAGRSAALCNRAAPGLRPLCFNGIGTILGGLSRDLDARRDACRTAAPRRYRSDCLAGAGA